jgi:hypothetical protein
LLRCALPINSKKTMKTKSGWRISMGAAALLSAAAAVAQMLSPGYALTGAPMSNFLSTSYLTQSVVNDLAADRRPAARLQAAARDAGSAAALVVSLRGAGTASARLAAAYPEAQRAQARALFDDLLRRYGGIERQFGIPRGDLGGAVAAFLAGSWMGLHDADFPDAHFMPAVVQMRAMLAAQPALRDAPAAEQRTMYEQMAIVGMLMAGTQMALKQEPDARVRQQMQEAGRTYLRQFLGPDAERLRFTAQGIELR